MINQMNAKVNFYDTLNNKSATTKMSANRFIDRSNGAKPSRLWVNYPSMCYKKQH